MSQRIIVELAERVRRLAPSGIAELTALAGRQARAGRSLLRLDAEDLGWTPPPLPWIGAGGEGEVRRWLADRFGCPCSSGDEVLVLRGPLAPHHLLALAFVNPGESVLVPDPGPQVLRTAALLAGAVPVGATRGGESDEPGAASEAGSRARLRAGGGAAGRLDAQASVARTGARLQFLAPLGPPTGQPDPPGFLDDAVASSLKESRILVEDVSGLLLDLGAAADETGPAASHPTLLSHPRGADAGVEVLTFDALFGAGRSPFSVIAGNRDIVAGARRLAGALGLPVGAPAARPLAQFLGAVDAAIDRARPKLAGRRDELAGGLYDLGLPARLPWPAAGFTLWVRLPRGYRSLPFARILLRRAGVLVRPGTDYGESGEGRIAISYALSRVALHRALEKFDKRAPRKLLFERQVWKTMRRLAERIRSR